MTSSPEQRRSKAVLLAFGLVAGTLLAEGAIRLTDALHGQDAHARTYWYWLFEQDPCLGFRGRARARISWPNETVAHDDEGFRDDRDFARLASVDRSRLVVCVGESSTYGISAGSNDRTYPSQLERELRRLSGDRRWVVFNAGVPAYTSREAAELIELRLRRLRPAAIVAMNLRNDLEFVARRLDDRLDYNRFLLREAPLSRSTVNELFLRSSLVGLVVSEFLNRAGDDLRNREPAQDAPRPTARGLDFYLSNLERMKASCDRAGVRLLLVDQPVDVRFERYDPDRKASLAILRSSLREFCTARGVDLLEADARFPWGVVTPEDDVHLGPEGYSRLAGILAPQILTVVSGMEPERREGDGGGQRPVPPGR